MFFQFKNIPHGGSNIRRRIKNRKVVVLCIIALICILPLTFASDMESISIQNTAGTQSISAKTISDLRDLNESDRAKPENAKLIQTWLKNNELYNGDINGNLTSNETLFAICDFQYQSGILIDGFVGNETIEMMQLWDLQKKIAKNGDLTKDSNGENVEVLQNFLKKRGYYNGKINGIYDENTINAVKYFQEDNNLPTNGITNIETITALKNKVAAAAVETQMAAPVQTYSSSKYTGSSTGYTRASTSSYVRKTSSYGGGYAYSSIGDCWAHSAWYSSKLRAQGYSTRVVQYATSLSSRHRSVQVYKNGKWVNADYSSYNKIYSPTSGSSSGKVVG